MRKPKPAPRPLDTRRPLVFDEEWFTIFPEQSVRVRRWHPSDVTHEHDEGNDYERGWMVFAHRNGRRMVYYVPQIASPPHGSGKAYRRALLRKIRALRLHSFGHVAREETRFQAALQRIHNPTFQY